MARSKITQPCEHCGHSFTGWTGNPNRFCSQECYHSFKKPIKEHFLSKVEQTPSCWIWTAGRTDSGYGKFLKTSAHRASWEIYNGPIPDSLFVLHRCDNPPCVNPTHLFLGTAADNMQDCIAKGRSSRGSKHPNAILSEEQVREIRATYKKRITPQRVLAERYGIAMSTVSAIINRKLWHHLV